MIYLAYNKIHAAFGSQRRSPTLSKNAQQEIATPDKLNTSSRKVRSQQLTFGTTKWLAYTALFAALSIVMKLIGQCLTLTDSFKITLIYVIWLIAAAVVGPIGGGTVCFVSDVLGAVIIPRGPINPLLTLGCVLFGVTAAFCFKLPVKSYIVKFVFAGVVCSVLYTLLFDSFAIWVWCRYYLKLKSYINKSFWVYLGPSRAMQLGVAAINIAVTVAMIPLLLRLKLLPPLKKASDARAQRETKQEIKNQEETENAQYLD